MRLTFSFCCWLFSVALLGQQAPDCNDMLRQAKNFEKNNDLSKAVQFYLNALNCNTALSGEIGPRLKGVFEKIEQQKEREQKATRTAEQRLRDIQRQSLEIQANTKAGRAKSLMTEGRYSEAITAAAEANTLRPNGESQALMAAAFEAMQQPGGCRLAKTFRSEIKNISKMYFNSRAGILVAADETQGISVLYKFSADSVPATPLIGRASEVYFSPDHRRMVIAENDSYVTLWDTEGKKISDLPVPFFNEKCRIEFSPCSQYLLYQNNFSATLWTSDGLTLINGADSLRPAFTDRYYRPSESNLLFSAIFFTYQGITGLETFGGPGEQWANFWDLNLLFQGKKEKSLMTVEPSALTFFYADTPVADSRRFQLSSDTKLRQQYLSVYESDKLVSAIRRDQNVTAFAADGDWLVAAAEGGEITLWQFNWRLGFEKRYPAQCLARFAPGGNRILAFEAPFFFHLVDFEGRERIQHSAYHFNVSQLLEGKICDPSGQYILNYFGRNYAVRDTTGRLLHLMQAPGYIRNAIWSENGKNAVMVVDSLVYNVNLLEQNPGFEVPVTLGGNYRLSAQGQFVWIQDKDSTHSLIRLRDGKTTLLPGKALEAYFSPEGHFIAVQNARKQWTLFRTDNGLSVRLQKPPVDLVFSPDERFMLAYMDDESTVLYATSGATLYHSPKKMEGVFSSRSRFLLLQSLSDDENILVDIQNGAWKKLDTEGRVVSCAFSPDERYAACGFAEGNIRILETAATKWLRSIPQVGAVKISPKGNYILTQVDYNATLFSFDGTYILSVPGSAKDLPEYQISPDDHWLLVSDKSGKLRLIPTPLRLQSYFLKIQ